MRVESVAAEPRPIPISLIFLIAFVIHAPLLLMKLPLKSYDTNFHIFFASHYAHHWFDPWNPKWYAGFSQMTYPPLPQQWVALISKITGLDMAYMVVQFVAILLLALGVLRFARLWVDERSASYAALASVFLGSQTFLVYSAGQLSTTSAAPLYLNALPYLYEWVRRANWRAFLKGVVLSVAAAAAHNATLLFGAVLFALPVLGLAVFASADSEPVSSALAGNALKTEGSEVSDRDRPAGGIVARIARAAGVLALVMVGVVIVLLPFWIALLRYPVTQTPIPHPSRANYLLSPEWGLNYFVVPYGALILAFPFIVWRGSSTPRLRPLLLGFWLAFLVGLGGTTPVGRVLLGRAYEVITLERFTYWAALLALPFAGLLAARLVDRYRRPAAFALIAIAALSCGAALNWGSSKPAEVVDFQVDSVAAWLNRDGHDHYRYVTLGFGNRIARLAVLTDASSVDGEWNTGRRLPELNEHGAGPLNNSKYFGNSGLEALRDILGHADHYGLKWVFMRDSYYEPLLVFAGWRKVDDLEDRTISVWGKDGTPPATAVNASQIPPAWQGWMWGILPIGSSILAIFMLFIPDEKEVARRLPRPVSAAEELEVGRLVS